MPGEAGDVDAGSAVLGATLDAPESHSRAEQLGTTPAERVKRAKEYAIEHGIDLASAYLVLLGIMPPDKAKPAHVETPTVLERTGPVEAGASAPPPAPAGVPDKEAHWDRTFDKAIADGTLTVPQALQRGVREVYASRLVKKHRLTMETAYDVADNRIKLRELLAEREKSAQPAEPAAPKKPFAITSHAIVLTAVAIVAVYCLVGIARHAQPVAGAPGDRAAPAPQPGSALVKTSFEIRKDKAGKLIAIRGSDPIAVLKAIGDSADTEAPREIVKVVSGHDVWTGYFRGGGKVTPVRVRNDARAGDWFAENLADLDAPKTH